MSCWVAPSIAADMWGVSVEEILRRARQGEVSARTEHGFFLIDVQPEGNSPKISLQTFTVVDDSELAALSDEIDESREEAPAPAKSPADEDTAGIEEWREVRRRMGRLRIPPRPQSPPRQAYAA